MNRLGSIMGASVMPVEQNRMANLDGILAGHEDDAIRAMSQKFGGLRNFQAYLQSVAPSPNVEVRGPETETIFNYTPGLEAQRQMDAEDADEAETRPTFKPERDPASDFNTEIYNLMRRLNLRGVR